MMKKLFTILIGLFCYLTLVQAQVVTTDPAFPTTDAAVTIYFDATQGTGGLEDCNCDVYLHTGVITSNSSSPSDWKYVSTEWGVANAAWKLDPVPGEDNLYSYEITPSIIDYYGVPMGEVIEQMAFVFRNANGSLEGKDVGGADIFVDVFDGDIPFVANLLSPSNTALVADINDIIPIVLSVSEEATITITDNGDELIEETTENLEYDLQVATPGNHEVVITADNGTDQQSFTIKYAVAEDINPQSIPQGSKRGINFLDENTVRLVLYAPNKDHVFVIGDFNDYTPDVDYQMTPSTDGATWWIDIAGLESGENYTYQYLVDGTIKIADPYSTVVLDDFHDQFIPNPTYPDLPDFPSDKTSGIVTLLQPGAENYTWQTNDFEKPEKEDLVIYELLLRDFIARHDYTTLIDTLDYLDRLGVNAIELMPINEFEGNNSWGYNPSFHMALDKYYGPINEFKRFIDECHSRGIAIIVDVVYNHAFSQSPLCQLYWDANSFRPSPDNPWFNVEATHAFNVGYDFNHESTATRDFVDQVMEYWLEEFRIDGFRFDLSKGFTQNANGPFDAGAYDASRIAILKHYADVMWATTSDAYVILEHFADNNEERELSNYGMMLWGNMNYQYNEATMGYNSDLNWGSYQARGWNDPHLVTYMESHDEERLMFKNLEYGNSSGNYSVKDLETALRRIELASAFFYTIPGPKMVWQFYELGYDHSIFTCSDGTVNLNDDGCKLSPKPIRWDFNTESDRLRLYDISRALINLKLEHEVFSTTDFNLNVNQRMKSIQLNGADMDVAVAGNFDVITGTISDVFPETGWWYEYFTGDSIQVNDVSMSLELFAGEYRLYTSVRLDEPPGGYLTQAEEIVQDYFDLSVMPNPSKANRNLRFDLEVGGRVQMEVLDVMGKQVAVLLDEKRAAGAHTLEWNQQLSPGTYFLSLTAANKKETIKVLIIE